MTRIMDWEGDTGATWAEEWERTDRSFGGLTERLLQRSREFSFGKVLDIGCGAGELSLALARGRPECRVVGVDISAQLVAAARQRGGHLPNVDFVVGDAATWMPGAEFVPDLLVSRHGVMFFDEPVAAFRHLREVSAPRAGFMFSCFRGPEVNEIFTGIGKLLPPRVTPPDPRAVAPMAFADPEHVRGLLTSAGWSGVEFESFDFAAVVGIGPDPLEDAVGYFLSIGPAAESIATAPAAERLAFEDRLHEFLAKRLQGGIVALGAGAWIVTAHNG